MKNLPNDKFTLINTLIAKVDMDYKGLVDAIAYHESESIHFFYAITSENQLDIHLKDCKIVTWDELHSALSLKNNYLSWILSSRIVYSTEEINKNRFDDIKFNAYQLGDDVFNCNGHDHLTKAKALFFDMYQNQVDYMPQILCHLLHAIAYKNKHCIIDPRNLNEMLRSFSNKPLDLANRIEEVASLPYMVAHRPLEELIHSVDIMFESLSCKSLDTSLEYLNDLYKNIDHGCDTENYLTVYFLAAEIEAICNKLLGNIKDAFPFEGLMPIVRSKDFKRIKREFKIHKETLKLAIEEHKKTIVNVNESSLGA